MKISTLLRPFSPTDLGCFKYGSNEMSPSLLEAVILKGEPSCICLAVM